MHHCFIAKNPLNNAMNFKQWLIRNEATLYHGSIVDNIPSILKYGLLGQAGSFTQDAYGDYYDDLPELTFAADKKGVERAVTAMTQYIARKLNKDFHDVTENDIRNHGVLFIIKDGDQATSYRPQDDENYYGQHPLTVEPGDYYADELGVDSYLTGSALLRYLRKLRVWPKADPFGSYNSKTLNLIKGDLGKRAVAAHPEIPKQQVLDKINAIKPKDMMNFLQTYRKS